MIFDKAFKVGSRPSNTVLTRAASIGSMAVNLAEENR
jgi:hypothetical protein